MKEGRATGRPTSGWDGLGAGWGAAAYATSLHAPLCGQLPPCPFSQLEVKHSSYMKLLGKHNRLLDKCDKHQVRPGGEGRHCRAVFTFGC